MISRVQAKLRRLLPTVTSSADERSQLQDRLRIYRIDQRDLKTTLEEAHTDFPYADYSEELLSHAEDALAEGNVESFWRSVSAAKRWEMQAFAQLEESDENQLGTDRKHGLTPLQVRAQEILLEATDMLSSQSRTQIKELLGSGNSFGESVEAIDILAATQLLYNGLIKEYRETKRFRILKRQLVYFVIIGLASVMSIILLWEPIYATSIDITNERFFRVVACSINIFPSDITQFVIYHPGLCYLSMIFLFGVIGATTSSILSLSRGILGMRVPEQVGTLGLTIARVTVGGTSALVIYIFLIAGIIEIITLTPAVAFAFAFGGGFTERVLVQAVEAIAGTSQDGDSIHPQLRDELNRNQ